MNIVYIYACADMFMREFYECVCVCTPVCTHARVYAYVYVCMDVCDWVYWCVCVCVFLPCQAQELSSEIESLPLSHSGFLLYFSLGFLGWVWVRGEAQ